MVTEKAERYGMEFALSMIKLRGFGGPSEFWDYNLESFTLMAGLAAVTSRIQSVRDLLGADAAAADRRAYGGDDRQHLARPLRPQHDHRLAGEEYSPDGYLARRAAPPAPLRLLRRIRDDYARVVGDRTQRFTGEFFQMEDCRCLPSPAARIPIICAGQSDRGTEFAATYADYNFCSSFGINDPHAVAPSTARLVAANARTGRDCGALVVMMVIAEETDAAALEKWEHYREGIDMEALAGGSRRRRPIRAATNTLAPAGSPRSSEPDADDAWRAGRIL